MRNVSLYQTCYRTLNTTIDMTEIIRRQRSLMCCGWKYRTWKLRDTIVEAKGELPLGQHDPNA